MSKKIEETIIIRNNKLLYAVRLISKMENADTDNNPYIVVEDGQIKYLDCMYFKKSEFNFSDEVHVIAKEMFTTALKTAIKEQILELKQLEIILSELDLSECIGESLSESANFLQKIKHFLK